MMVAMICARVDRSIRPARYELRITPVAVVVAEDTINPLLANHPHKHPSITINGGGGTGYTKLLFRAQERERVDIISPIATNTYVIQWRLSIQCHGHGSWSRFGFGAAACAQDKHS